MVNACADPDFFCQRERGGGGVQAQLRENSLDFLFVLGFFSPKFYGDAGGPTIYGGGVQMLISIEFDRTCDLPGMGVRTPSPPSPPVCTRTCMTFKD